MAVNGLTASIPSTRRVSSPWPLNILNTQLAPAPIRTTNRRNNCKFSDGLFITHCSAKPNTQTDNVPTPTWDQPSNPSGLVFDLGKKESWDNVEIGSPVVKRYLGDEEERWYMWYHGRSTENPSSDLVGLAVSNNGIHWERGQGKAQSSDDTGLVLKCSEDWWSFDTVSIQPSEVVVMSSSKIRASSAVYWLYYTGYNAEMVELGTGFNGETVTVSKSLPGLAMSQDGRNWARIEGEHHSGALLDVGSKGEWDSLFIASPQVVYHVSGDLRMYYHSFDAQKGHYAIGMARSRDGIRWIKLGKIIGGGREGRFDEFGALNARVVRNKKDGKYVMAYEGVGENGERSIGLAVSPDGLQNWTKVNDESVLKRCEENGWDDKGVGSPCLVQMESEESNDNWRLYYTGYGKNGETGIGLAICKGNQIESFTRWTGFHL